MDNKFLGDGGDDIHFDFINFTCISFVHEDVNCYITDIIIIIIYRSNNDFSSIWYINI